MEANITEDCSSGDRLTEVLRAIGAMKDKGKVQTTLAKVEETILALDAELDKIHPALAFLHGLRNKVIRAMFNDQPPTTAVIVHINEPDPLRKQLNIKQSLEDIATDLQRRYHAQQSALENAPDWVLLMNHPRSTIRVPKKNTSATEKRLQEWADNAYENPTPTGRTFLWSSETPRVTVTGTANVVQK